MAVSPRVRCLHCNSLRALLNDFVLVAGWRAWGGGGKISIYRNDAGTMSLHFQAVSAIRFLFREVFRLVLFLGGFSLCCFTPVGRGVIFSELHRIKTQPFTSTSMPALISPTGYGDRPPTRKIAWPLKDDTPESCCTSHTLLRSSDPLNTTNTTNHQTHTLSPTPTKSKRLSSSTQGPKCLFSTRSHQNLVLLEWRA